MTQTTKTATEITNEFFNKKEIPEKVNQHKKDIKQSSFLPSLRDASNIILLIATTAKADKKAKEKTELEKALEPILKTLNETKRKDTLPEIILLPEGTAPRLKATQIATKNFDKAEAEIIKTVIPELYQQFLNILPDLKENSNDAQKKEKFINVASRLITVLNLAFEEPEIKKQPYYNALKTLSLETKKAMIYHAYLEPMVTDYKKLNNPETRKFYLTYFLSGKMDDKEKVILDKIQQRLDDIKYAQQHARVKINNLKKYIHAYVSGEKKALSVEEIANELEIVKEAYTDMVNTLANAEPDIQRYQDELKNILPESIKDKIQQLKSEKTTIFLDIIDLQRANKENLYAAKKVETNQNALTKIAEEVEKLQASQSFSPLLQLKKALQTITFPSEEDIEKNHLLKGFDVTGSIKQKKTLEEKIDKLIEPFREEKTTELFKEFENLNFEKENDINQFMEKLNDYSNFIASTIPFGGDDEADTWATLFEKQTLSFPLLEKMYLLFEIIEKRDELGGEYGNGITKLIGLTTDLLKERNAGNTGILEWPLEVINYDKNLFIDKLNNQQELERLESVYKNFIDNHNNDPIFPHYKKRLDELSPEKVLLKELRLLNVKNDDAVDEFVKQVNLASSNKIDFDKLAKEDVLAVNVENLLWVIQKRQKNKSLLSVLDTLSKKLDENFEKQPLSAWIKDLVEIEILLSQDIAFENKEDSAQQLQNKIDKLEKDFEAIVKNYPYFEEIEKTKTKIIFNTPEARALFKYEKDLDKITSKWHEIKLDKNLSPQKNLEEITEEKTIEISNESLNKNPELALLNEQMKAIGITKPFTEMPDKDFLEEKIQKQLDKQLYDRLKQIEHLLSNFWSKLTHLEKNNLPNPIDKELEFDKLNLEWNQIHALFEKYDAMEDNFSQLNNNYQLSIPLKSYRDAREEYVENLTTYGEWLATLENNYPDLYSQQELFKKALPPSSIEKTIAFLFDIKPETSQQSNSKNFSFTLKPQKIIDSLIKLTKKGSKTLELSQELERQLKQQLPSYKADIKTIVENVLTSTEQDKIASLLGLLQANVCLLNDKPESGYASVLLNEKSFRKSLAEIWEKKNDFTQLRLLIQKRKELLLDLKNTLGDKWDNIQLNYEGKPTLLKDALNQEISRTENLQTEANRRAEKNQEETLKTSQTQVLKNYLNGVGSAPEWNEENKEFAHTFLEEELAHLTNAVSSSTIQSKTQKLISYYNELKAPLNLSEKFLTNIELQRKIALNNIEQSKREEKQTPKVEPLIETKAETQSIEIKSEKKTKVHNQNSLLIELQLVNPKDEKRVKEVLKKLNKSFDIGNYENEQPLAQLVETLGELVKNNPEEENLAKLYELLATKFNARFNNNPFSNWIGMLMDMETILKLEAEKEFYTDHSSTVTLLKNTFDKIKSSPKDNSIDEDKNAVFNYESRLNNIISKWDKEQLSLAIQKPLNEEKTTEQLDSTQEDELFEHDEDDMDKWLEKHSQLEQEKEEKEALQKEDHRFNVTRGLATQTLLELLNGVDNLKQITNIQGREKGEKAKIDSKNQKIWDHVKKKIHESSKVQGLLTSLENSRVAIQNSADEPAKLLLLLEARKRLFAPLEELIHKTDKTHLFQNNESILDIQISIQGNPVDLDTLLKQEITSTDAYIKEINESYPNVLEEKMRLQQQMENAKVLPSMMEKFATNQEDWINRINQTTDHEPSLHALEEQRKVLTHFKQALEIISDLPEENKVVFNQLKSDVSTLLEKTENKKKEIHEHIELRHKVNKVLAGLKLPQIPELEKFAEIINKSLEERLEVLQKKVAAFQEEVEKKENIDNLHVKQAALAQEISTFFSQLDVLKTIDKKLDYQVPNNIRTVAQEQILLLEKANHSINEIQKEETPLVEEESINENESIEGLEKSLEETLQQKENDPQDQKQAKIFYTKLLHLLRECGLMLNDEKAQTTFYAEHSDLSTVLAFVFAKLIKLNASPDVLKKVENFLNLRENQAFIKKCSVHETPHKEHIHTNSGLMHEPLNTYKITLPGFGTTYLTMNGNKLLIKHELSENKKKQFPNIVSGLKEIFTSIHFSGDITPVEIKKISSTPAQLQNAFKLPTVHLPKVDLTKSLIPEWPKFKLDVLKIKENREQRKQEKDAAFDELRRLRNEMIDACYARNWGKSDELFNELNQKTDQFWDHYGKKSTKDKIIINLSKLVFAEKHIKPIVLDYVKSLFGSPTARKIHLEKTIDILSGIKMDETIHEFSKKQKYPESLKQKVNYAITDMLKPCIKLFQNELKAINDYENKRSKPSSKKTIKFLDIFKWKKENNSDKEQKRVGEKL